MTTTIRQDKIREAAKRQILGMYNEDGAKETKIVGTNRDHVSMILEELKGRLQQQLEGLKADYNTGKSKQRQVLTSGMTKLKKNVKTMTVSEFNALFKCNLIDSIKRVREEHSKKPTLSKKRDRMEAETPEPVRRSHRNLETPSRTVRRGEAMFSQNGSPLETADEGALVATVNQKRRGHSKLPEGAISAANFDVNVGEGKFISLMDPSGVKDLDNDMKTTILSQLEIFQDQVATIIQGMKSEED